jgi:hypothetical protein
VPTPTDTLDRLRAGQLKGIERLDLNCGLTAFPREIFDLADSLQVLNLSGNSLTSLPDDLPRLRHLRVIFGSDNRFTALPAVLGQCAQVQMIGFKANQIQSVPSAALPPHLRWLILTDNHIEALPDSLGDCARLQKLMLAGNRLQQLPAQLAQCQQLELLRISANQLEVMPPWLVDMPRLAWLACAGNPFSDAYTQAPQHAPYTVIEWHNLRLQHVLGEGASGVIYQALLTTENGGHPQAGHNGSEPRTVAVKLFKGAVTSDGWPHSEVAACLAAAIETHPNVIPVIGALAGHPDGTPGLVMQLIPPRFVTLAGPPSLQTCTRDVYRAGSRFSPPKIMLIALGVARAAAHLHDHGLLHGDLYAHNLQCDANGFCLLGDMGAATFLPADKAASQALQRLEVRAFGCLLEELLAHQVQAPPDALTALQDSCQGTPAQRPLFSEIVQHLESIRWLDQHRRGKSVQTHGEV